MQVSTLSSQVCVRSELIGWDRDATSVSYGHLLIDLWPRSDDRLRYCTNSSSIPSSFYMPERLKHLKSSQVNAESLEGCTHRVVLLMGLSAT